MPRPARLECSPLEPREVPAAALFADIVPGVWGSYPRNLTPSGGTLFFTAEGPYLGNELWATDGTTAGTRLVKDINPGKAASNPNAFYPDGRGGVFFTADGGGGPTLWHSDGTAAGTVNLGLKDVFSPFDAGNGVVYVYGNTGGGSTLWRSDGTVAGTKQVTGVPDALSYHWTSPPPGHGVDSILAQSGLSMTAWKGELYFVLQDANSGKLQWAKTNGTGYTVLSDFQDTAVSGYVQGDAVRVFGDRLELTLNAKDAGANGQGVVVWQTDGTAAGTQLLERTTTSTDPTPGTLTFPVTAFEPATEITPGRFVYARQKSLWVGDGHTDGSYQLVHQFPQTGATPPAIGGLKRVGDKVYFLVGRVDIPPTEPMSVWVTDGTAVGTHQISGLGTTETNPAVGRQPFVGSLGDKMLVRQASTDHTFWLTDGTTTTQVPVPAGTETLPWTLVGNLPADGGSASGYLLFQEAQSSKVYRTDGTAAGTALIDTTGLPARAAGTPPIGDWYNPTGGTHLNPFGGPTDYQNGVNYGTYFNGAVYYSGKTDVQRPELWKWDLTGRPTATAPAPKVTGAVVNDGSAQRSAVKTLTVKFDAAVNVDLAGVTVNGSLGGQSSFQGVLSTTDGVTTLTVTFPEQLGGSIPDGRWTLKIAAGAVRRVGGGTAMAADYTFGFTRLVGDLTGDGVYDRAARTLVHQLLGHRVGDADFNPALDANGDGVIDAADETAVVRNWGKSV